MLLAYGIFAVPGLAAWVIWGESTVRYALTAILSVLVQPFLAAFWMLLFLRLQERTPTAEP